MGPEQGGRTGVGEGDRAGSAGGGSGGASWGGGQAEVESRPGLGKQTGV